MKLLNRYEFSQSPTELIIVLGRNRHILNSLIYIAVIVVWYLVLFNQNPRTDNSLIYLFYLAPLLILPTVFKSLKNSFKPDIFKFDKSLGDFTVNDLRCANLSGITKVIVDYPNKLDIEECTLELVIEGQSNVKIDKSDASSNAEVIRTAKRIADFLNIAVADRHPYDKKI